MAPSTFCFFPQDCKLFCFRLDFFLRIVGKLQSSPSRSYVRVNRLCCTLQISPCSQKQGGDKLGCIDAAAEAASCRKSRCFLGAPTLNLDAFQNKDFRSKINQHTIRKYNKHDGTGCSISLLHMRSKKLGGARLMEKTLFLPTCLMSHKPLLLVMCTK